MAKITQDMRNIFEKSNPYIVTTATKEGKPNGVPVGLVKIVSDDEILVGDVLMKKTLQNIAENPTVAVTAWDIGVHYGYQLKGTARVETSGEMFDQAVDLLKSRTGDLKLTVKSAVVVKVEEAYYIGMGHDTGIDLLA
jgi:predicted pyridoxine 5'-phosphate oxidase superfamily flavin-nucleotide-binding protein